jgi:2'-5' RNA ligase
MADDEVQTGAMIALVPTADDAARLAVEGGEPVDDLHCTVLYLGEAADIADDERQAVLDWAATMAANWERVDGEAFAPAVFNPTGDEPCAVLVLSGAELAEFYETSLADVSDLVALPPDLHQPYVPHATLRYGPADELWPLLPSLAERTGPVAFDRLRVAFAGENTDIVFGEPAPADDAQPVDEPVDEVSVVADAWSLPRWDFEPELAVVAAAFGVDDFDRRTAQREAWDGCPRGFHPAHTGNCPPAL